MSLCEIEAPPSLPLAEMEDALTLLIIYCVKKDSELNWLQILATKKLFQFTGLKEMPAVII